MKWNSTIHDWSNVHWMRLHHVRCHIGAALAPRCYQYCHEKQQVLVARYLVVEWQQPTLIYKIFPMTLRTQLCKPFFPACQPSLWKLRGFVSEGENVMVGWHNGVAAQLKNCSLSLILIHCVSHRLTLAASHAAYNIPYLQHFKSLLHNLFSFY